MSNCAWPRVSWLSARAFAKGALVALWAGSALAETPSPFVPPPPPKPRIVRLLAGEEFIDPRVLSDFEASSGWAIAYDAYDSPDGIADKWRDGPYDLVVLPGPVVARRASTLARLEKSKIPNARAVQPLVAAKLGAYDPGGAYAVAFGWSGFGLIYDAGKAAQRLGGTPVSWGQLLLPREAVRLSECGVALPDARDAMFVAAWRLMGVDPSHANLVDVKSAAALISRVRPAAAFGLRDVVGAMARGADCLSAGSAGEAAAADARARESGGSADIRFTYAREGGAVTIEAFAIPRDAPTPNEAYALLDFLLRPENAARDAKFAGLVSAEDASQVEPLKHLSPEGAFDDRIAAAVAAEWTRLRAAK
jgi:putrescine transport system substrate-binding protein